MSALIPARLLSASRPAKTPARLSEVFSTPGDPAAALAVLLTHLPKDAPVLWARDWTSRAEAGGLYLPGREVITVDLSHPRDVLIALEEGLRCTALGAVVGEIWGNPKALDFTASKRLALRAEAGGRPCWLLRHGAARDLSAARDRWQVASLASPPHPDDPRAPGPPRWRVELFRSRDKKPGLWQARYDRTADRLDLVAADGDRALAAPAGPSGQSPDG